MRIKIYVMGLKGLTALTELNPKYKNLLSKVVIGTDKAIEEDYSKEIQKVSQENNLNFDFDKDEKLNNDEIGIAIGWRWMINCEENLFVIHDSLLPKYRGFNPLVSALINGEEELGLSILKANAEFDKGEIAIQLKTKVDYPLTIKDAIEKVSNLYGKGINLLFDQLTNDSLILESQLEENATYSVWRDEDDYFIDWSEDSERIKRHIDAVGFPYLGARIKNKNQILIVKEAMVVPDLIIENRTVGKVLMKSDLGCIVICGKGLLAIKEFYTIDGDVYKPKKFRMKFS